MNTIYALRNFETKEVLGYVSFSFPLQTDTGLEELPESWHDYHVLEEHEMNPNDVTSFVAWHNQNWFCKIEETGIDPESDQVVQIIPEFIY